MHGNNRYQFKLGYDEKTRQSAEKRTIPVDVFPLPYPATNVSVEKRAKLAVLMGRALFTAWWANRESMVRNDFLVLVSS